MYNAITDIEGLKVGHASDYKGYTGCTVILCEEGAVCGIDIRGSASGTRQIDALSIGHIVDRIHGVMLAGGSAFGLDAAEGVVRYLEEKKSGFNVGVTRVPIVPSAVIFDLTIGDAMARPTAEMAYDACINAGNEVEEGSVGAGTGATVGKLFEMNQAMKGGVGTCSVAMPDGLRVGALVVVNAFGDVIDNITGKIIAGLRKSEKDLEFAGTAAQIKQGVVKKHFGMSNTTLGVVATNAQFDKKETTKVAQMAQAGLIKTINPVHTTFDGDLIFSLATGKLEVEADVNRVGVLAEFALAEAVKRAVKKANGFGMIPAFRDISKGWKTI